MIPASGCPPWPPDHPRTQSRTGNSTPPLGARSTAPNLVVPDGLRLAYLPPYSPELQPAEHLWPIVDEPLANRYFATRADLERTVADRCRVLEGDQLKLGTNFHWWPKPATPS